MEFLRTEKMLRTQADRMVELVHAVREQTPRAEHWTKKSCSLEKVRPQRQEYEKLDAVLLLSVAAVSLSWHPILLNPPGSLSSFPEQIDK